VFQLLGELFAKVEPSRVRELPRDLDLPKVTREIGRVLTRALEMVRDLPEQARTEVMRVTRDIVQVLRFSEQISNCATFAQLPLMLNGERTTAQLYVFNDSGEKKKIDPQNATIFLSLSTTNLGTVEGFVKVIGMGVEADFTLQTDDSARLFRSGLTQLAELLEVRGYRLERLSAAVAQESEPLSPAAVEKGRWDMSGRYTFNRAV
jgi:homospermidine synthase